MASSSRQCSGKYWRNSPLKAVPGCPSISSVLRVFPETITKSKEEIQLKCGITDEEFDVITLLSDLACAATRKEQLETPKFAVEHKSTTNGAGFVWSAQA